MTEPALNLTPDGTPRQTSTVEGGAVSVDLTGLPPEHAFNPGIMTAELIAEAVERGYARAVAALVDTSRYDAWCRAGELAGDRDVWPRWVGPSERRKLAEYLTASRPEADGSDG